MRRNTQTAAYWQESFKINTDDLDYLAGIILEKDEPQRMDDLTYALIDFRCQREENKIRSELSRGEIYQPHKHYEPGQRLVFPTLDYALGTVIGLRSGHNPEHGEFAVIKVEFDGEGRTREFAADLKVPHRLSRGEGDTIVDTERSHSTRDLYVMYGPAIQTAVQTALSQSAQPAFVQEQGLWLLRDMLVDIHVGLLNIAEAIIEVKAQPVSTTDLLGEMNLPAEVPERIRRVSVNAALRHDSRFDDVGSGEESAWYLRRLEPVEAYVIPNILRYQATAYDRLVLGVELLQLEWELDDEWSTDALVVDTPMLVPSTTIMLIYPHLCSGTLPLSSRARSLFPAGQGTRTMITLIDGRWGARFPAWVNYEGRYIAGVGGWLEQHKLPVGSFITLERTREPLEYVVDFRPRRMRREWIRVADEREGELNFQLQKQAVSSDYDEYLAVGEASRETLEKMRAQIEKRRLPLSDLVRHIARELVGLSPQGTVHAKTVYSAVNMVRRCPPGPIFASMATDSSLRSVGSGYWSLANRT
jgi:hypothetical protein